MSLRHFCSFSFTEQPGITVSMEKLISQRQSQPVVISISPELRQMTLEKDGGRLSRLDNSGSNKTV